MMDLVESPHWAALLRPFGGALTALGRLGHALESTPLHQAWLWREVARSSARIAQFSGHRVRLERLMLTLAGVPLEPGDDDAGLAAARRLFLMAAPLFREPSKVESERGLEELFEPLWPSEGDGQAGALPGLIGGEGGGEGLERMVRALIQRTGSDDRPPLLDLLLGLFRRGRMRRAHARFALPLALQRTAILPKAAPSLLAGRLSFSVEGDDRITSWLARALGELSGEATAAVRRLDELSDQHRAWREQLSSAGLRGHSRLPAVLDFLAVTPVLSASLVARQLACSPQGAGAMLRQLAELGIVKGATPRARWKIYLAADLALPGKSDALAKEPLSFSEPVPAFDREAAENLLDGLLFDLERLERRTRMALAETES